MGGNPTTKTTQAGKSSSGPWSPTQPVLQNLIGQANDLSGGLGVTGTETGALGGLASNANAAAGYAPQINALTGNLFSGGGFGQGTPALQQAYGTASNALTPYAQGQYVGQSNPYTQQLLHTMGADITNQIGGQFAAAGRDMSPAYAQALSRGLSQGEAPTLFGQYNTDVQNQMNAANSLASNAGNYTGALDQSAGNILGAQMQAPGAIGNMNLPQQMQLGAAQTAHQLPFQNLSNASNFMLPIAGLGQQGTYSGTGSTVQMTNPFQTAIGAGLGGLGLLSMGSSGGLGGMLGTRLGGLLSDRRTKCDITRVGALDNGLPVYKFRYLDSNTMHIGCMADEVEVIRPEAVATDAFGMKRVDYDKATSCGDI